MDETKTTNTRKNVKLPLEDRIYYIIINTIIFIFTLIVLYPLIFVVSASFSSGSAVSTGKVILWPVDPGLAGYKAVFSHKLILSGYRNTIFYTVVGTIINIVVTMMCAYPLSRKSLPGRNFFMGIFTFTMFFGGGLIPTYMLITSLGMKNTVWALLIPGAMSVYNMILARTFLQSSIPHELLEASQIDGCNDFRYFFQIVLPLSKAIIAVLTLYYAVGHWNSYFSALIYINKPNLYPLQLILRQIFEASRVSAAEMTDPELIAKTAGITDLLKYSLIVVSTAPIMCVYPFIQKYFVKGVMIGSVKG